MLLPDVNVLVYAFRAEAASHERYREWLDGLVNSTTAFGMSELAVSGFLRVVTNPRIFRVPAPPALALDFADRLFAPSGCIPVRPGKRHYGLFAGLCHAVEARGPTVADAYHAALAIESGSEWVTADRGFARFPGLRWRHPFETA